MDWRIGRLIRRKSTNSPDIDSTPIELPPNQQRVAFLAVLESLSPIGDISALITIDNASVIALTQQHPQALISMTTHGDLPMGRISTVVVGGTAAVTITEFFMPEEYLAAGIEEFMRSIKKWTG
jgi:hypothetical protein